MTGLRERQKADRRKRILQAARILFAESGPENTTIDSIAERAGVSGVTVHNYYGTKSGVLLALVAESDRELVEKMRATLPGTCSDPIELTQCFSATVRAHAITFLDKPIWRQVIAASITDTVSRFGKTYRALDKQLAMILVHELAAMRHAGLLPPEAQTETMGQALFNIQNMQFIHFISSDSMSDADADAALLRDLRALMPGSEALANTPTQPKISPEA